MKKVFAIVGFAALVACSQAEEATEPAAEEAPALQDPASATGAFLLTFPDGSQMINVSRGDMTFYQTSGVDATGTWTSENGTFCTDPAAEGEETACYTFGEVAEDGTYPANQTDGTSVTVLRIDQDNQPGTPLDHSSGAHLVTNTDGSQFIGVTSPDGTYVTGPLDAKGTYTVVDGQRCIQVEGQEENCATPGAWDEDGTTFTVEGPEGAGFTVKRLL